VNPVDGERNLRLAFSYAQLEDIELGIQILGRVIEQF
jgi:DNA-binding transcriptional MocR family regulator